MAWLLASQGHQQTYIIVCIGWMDLCFPREKIQLPAQSHNIDTQKFNMTGVKERVSFIHTNRYNHSRSTTIKVRIFFAICGVVCVKRAHSSLGCRDDIFMIDFLNTIIKSRVSIFPMAYFPWLSAPCVSSTQLNSLTTNYWLCNVNGTLSPMEK